MDEPQDKKTTEFSNAPESEIFAHFFQDPDRRQAPSPATWTQPGHSLASRMICSILHITKASDQGFLFQEVFERTSHKFLDILQRFKEGTRNQTWNNFERFLYASIRNVVRDEFRKRGRKQRMEPLCEDQVIEAPPTGLLDTDRKQILQQWHQQALDTLSATDREILTARLVDEMNVRDIAEKLQMNALLVSRRLYQAQLKVRNEVIQRMAQRLFSHHPPLEERFRGLVQHLCQERKPCYLYRRVCPKALDIKTLSQKEFLCLEEEKVHQLSVDFEETIREELDNWDLGTSLDRCYWALR